MKIGAYAIEQDYSHYIAYASKTVLAVVGTASKGRVNEATPITSIQDLVSKFGPLNPSHYGLYACQYFLSQASTVYFVRAASANIKAAEVSVRGNDDGDDIDNAITFEMIDQGTGYNGYKLSVEKGVLDGHYTLKLINTNNVLIENIKDIALTDLVVGYTTKYMRVKSVAMDVTVDEEGLISDTLYLTQSGTE